MDDKALLDLAQEFLKNTDEGKKILKDEGLNIDLTKEDDGIEEVELTKEERKIKREKKREELKEKSKSYKESLTPIMDNFIINGRVYDELTTTPIQGVEVKPLLAGGKSVKTDNEGNFSITLRLPILPINSTILSKPVLIYSLKGYLPVYQELLTKNRKLRGDLPIVSLLNLKKAAEKELTELQNKINEKIEEANKFLLSLPDRLIIERRKSILRVISTVQNKLLPIAIGMLIAFGITKLSQKNQKTCPPPDQLKSIMKSRNDVTKQLNQFYKTLGLNVALAAAFIAISSLFKSGRITIQSLPIPLGAPLGIGQPYTVVSQLQGVEEELKILEEQNKKLNKQILVALIFLVASLAVIIVLMKEIDTLIQECAQNQNITLEEIEQDLLNLTIQEKDKGNPVISQLNGFIFSVESEKVPVGSLTRRYAVAKNSQGIVLLKGEPSFSSNDQILIDELIFYIESNDLKAY